MKIGQKLEGEQGCEEYRRVGGMKLNVQNAVICSECKGSCAQREHWGNQECYTHKIVIQ